MTKIAITGSAGMIGSALSHALAKEGHDLVLIDNLSHGYVENMIGDDGCVVGTFFPLDIRSKEMEKIFQGVDVVFHLAAISSLPECQVNPCEALSVNVAGTANVLESARRAKVKRVIFASTSAIYENNTTFPCQETDDVSPQLIYSLSKYQAELLCKSFMHCYNMEIVITRYYNVYGPNQDIFRKAPPFVGYAIREAVAGRVPLFHSTGDQKRDYVFIDDVNELNRICMEHKDAAGKIFNVCSGQAYSVKEIYALIQQQVSTAKQPVYRASTLLWEKYPELQEGFALKEHILTQEVNKFTLGATQAEKILQWHARTTLAEGIKKTVESIRARMRKKEGAV